MIRKKLLRSLFGVIAFGAIVLQAAVPARAQEMQPPPPPPPPPQYEQQAPPPPPPSSQPQYGEQMPPPPPVFQPYAPVNTAGKMRLSLSGAVGFGFDSVEVGRTTDNDAVKISGGGGVAVDLGMGFGLTPVLDLDFDLGAQASTLSPSVDNADGTFGRSYLLATVKIKRPTSETGQFKWGFGIGSYNNGELDIDARDAGGDHTIVKYDDAMGYHLTGEFERFFGPWMSVNLGAKMYFVEYKAKSVTNNGATVPVSGLISDVKKLNGNGMDFMVGLNVYF